MRVGVDFDNTIVCYDQAFHREALRRGLIPESVAARKEAVRDHLRRCGREDAWTELQGFIYGPGMEGAQPFPGVEGFFKLCRDRSVGVCIISHKTERPYQGPAYDLHASAQDWLRRQGFHDPAGIGLPAEQVFFELTKQAKLDRIAKARCDFFIDDLPEFLAEPAFPAGVARILFDPSRGARASQDWRCAADWKEVGSIVLPERSVRP